jgi:hypothetical protein
MLIVSTCRTVKSAQQQQQQERRRRRKKVKDKVCERENFRPFFKRNAKAGSIQLAPR